MGEAFSDGDEGLFPAVPDWAAASSSSSSDEDSSEGWSLECLKGGVSLGEFRLRGGRLVVGRGAEAVDLALAHESISRVHAVLQRSVEGRWYVADWSTHGTRLNKASVPRGKYVELKDGDVLVFGGSTRIFAVTERGEAAAARERAEMHDEERPRREVRRTRPIVTTKAPTTKEEEEEDTPSLFATWGMDEDVEATPDAPLPEYLASDRGFVEYGEEIKSTLLASERNEEKDAKLLEKLDAKVAKVNNVRREIRRLLAKEKGLDGLSDGQRSALDRSESKAARLLDEIAQHEAAIREKNASRDGTTKPPPHSAAAAPGAEARRRAAAAAAQRDRADDDDDDPLSGSAMRDLTEKLRPAKTAEERLERRKRRFRGGLPAAPPGRGGDDDDEKTNNTNTLEGLTEELRAVEARLESAERVAAALAAAASTVSEGPSDDALDEFLAANEDTRRADASRRVERDIATLTAKRRDLARLVAIATPALPGLRSAATRRPAPDAGGRPDQAPREQQTEERGPAEVPSAPRVDSPPSGTAPCALNPHSVAQAVRALTAAANPPPQRARLPEDGPPDQEPSRKDLAGAEPRKPQSSSSSKRRRVSGPANEDQQQPSTARAPRQLLQGGDSAWVPPADQDGSGRTKLNDLLGY